VVKEKQGYTDELGLKLAQLSFPSNGVRKLFGIFLTQTEKSVSAWIPL